MYLKNRPRVRVPRKHSIGEARQHAHAHAHAADTATGVQTTTETETSGNEEATYVHEQRMLNVGLCKKDLLATKKQKHKEKGAFCNCVVVVLRILHDGSFAEVHIKIFESGKLEIPGVKDDRLVHAAIEYLLTCIH